MARRPRGRPVRKRVGRVSYYLHHGSWFVYYREGGRQLRRRVADDEAAAERVAAQINAQLAAQTPTLLAFTPISIPEVRQKYLDLTSRSCIPRWPRSAATGQPLST
jgi:hypothetical protein